MSLLKSVKEKLIHHHLLLLILIYLGLRFVELTRLPIFNDEAIYLDWGLREISAPGALFYSLYDAKQPLLMWIFGMSEKLPLDPLFAGRAVSIFSGLLTMLGIYVIAKKISNKRVAYIASLTYIFVPIFSFFDRQALMESSISAIGVWSFYFFIQSRKEEKYKNVFLAGVILGIGFFIKSNALLFLIVIILFFVRDTFTQRNKKYLKKIMFLLTGFFIASLLLIIQPEFWNTLSSNSRYTLTLAEIVRFPYQIWMSNFWINFQILFFYLTPFIFSIICFSYYKYKKIQENMKLILLFCSCLLFFIVFTERNASQRYLVSYLPLLTIPFAFQFKNLIKRFNNPKKMVAIFIVFVIPVCMTSFELLFPTNYFLFMHKVTSVSDATEYMTNWTSGYAAQNAIAYILKNTNGVSFVGMALNTGNPESSVIVYMEKNNIPVGYIDSRMFSPALHQADCLVFPRKLYFVSRDEQLGGLDKFLIKVKTFKNLYGTNSVGIYTLPTHCTGKAFNLN